MRTFVPYKAQLGRDMGRAIERIEKDIAVLEEAIQAIAKELQSGYASYLAALGEALRKQLILASYHLCTQGYPENFLKLTLSQRQQLQQSLRQLGKKAGEMLITHLIGNQAEDNSHDLKAEANTQPSDAEEVINDDHSEPISASSDVTSQVQVLDISNPVAIAQWQQFLEKQIQSTLKKASHEGNLLFQKAGILPQKLPEQILEAAVAASETSSEMMPGPPNILNLVIEIEDQENAESSSLTQIMTIHLRLGEIEFADTTVSTNRKQIRDILVQLHKLGREYQKKQRERSIAEAESAWRASWYEE